MRNKTDFRTLADLPQNRPVRRLFFLFLVGCPSESAPVVAPSAPADASSEMPTPVLAASGDAAVVEEPPPPVNPLDPGLSKALLERLAREAESIPKGQLRKSPPRDAERDRAIRARFGERCKLERTCGPIWGIDCEAAVDGPYYYVLPRADGWRQITVCGGACMGGRCTNCPPKNEGWTCETY